jgi:hypothetical protein
MRNPKKVRVTYYQDRNKAGKLYIKTIRARGYASYGFDTKKEALKCAMKDSTRMLQYWQNDIIRSSNNMSEVIKDIKQLEGIAKKL